jgi:hypothetical protein
MASCGVSGCCPFFARRKNNKDKSRHRQRQSGLEASGAGLRENIADLQETAPPYQPTADIPKPPKTYPPDEAPVWNPSSRRIEAERNFKDAADQLERVMPTETAKFHIPEAIGLPGARPVKDVEETGKKIESAIEELINTRRELRDRPSKAREIKRWFRSSFPYLKRGLKMVGVCSFFSIVNAF